MEGRLVFLHISWNDKIKVDITNGGQMKFTGLWLSIILLIFTLPIFCTEARISEPVKASDDAIIKIETGIHGKPQYPSITKLNGVEYSQISDSFILYTTWHNFPGFGRVPSNGLIFMKNNRAIMIDTPVTEKDTHEIVSYLDREYHVKLSLVIVGHYHDDCLGGLRALHAMGITSIAGNLTRLKCREKGLPIPGISFARNLKFHFQGEIVNCRYFGGGHTADNIVVYFPESGILFGGCLIKSMDAKNMGNTAEAVMTEWSGTVAEISRELPDLRLVIPGHGASGGPELLEHTQNLVHEWKSSH
ncbi:MAG: subclass B1 metallo-beta-lactamase [Candidatus Wallbacteria bacterium HGW-Wallbacteria-1]|jgi:metallo-beta-lactamase class B|uniref:beta-lactamase n=1 Tax=Candidatus Wallbacteria bacterium HGW-Wallbacteria-1 TaxID=2013854 RepID=A0A2N1PKR2_9BACT|nr:MAG: subclass B1 metallo-beta-lactamase [Candidatus Wallbacteria bacterium HGW-Wallbacteria-1]